MPSLAVATVSFSGGEYQGSVKLHYLDIAAIQHGNGIPINGFAFAKCDDQEFYGRSGSDQHGRVAL